MLIVITDEEPGDNGAQLLGSAAGAIIVKPFNAQLLCSELERLIDLGPPAEPSA